ncbi:MAG: hypothetical protein ABI554_12405 [Flavobacterium sp.]
MKKKLVIVIALFSVIACTDKKTTEKQLSKEEIQNNAYETAEDELEDKNEKIVLLSFISKVPVDSLHQILKEYYSKDPEQYNYNDLGKVIDTISIKFKKPKIKIASLIYKFKYGMKTDEDILEEGLNNMESDRIEEHEPDGYGRSY